MNWKRDGSGYSFYGRHNSQNEDTTNKQKFISSLSSQMEKDSMCVKQSAGNADYGIVMSSSVLARTKPVVVVGDDTDLLILIQLYFNTAEHC